MIILETSEGQFLRQTDELDTSDTAESDWSFRDSGPDSSASSNILEFTMSGTDDSNYDNAKSSKPDGKVSWARTSWIILETGISFYGIDIHTPELDMCAND